VHVSDSKTTAAAGATTAGTTAAGSSAQTTTGSSSSTTKQIATGATAGATAVNADAVITKMVHVHHFCVYWNGDEGGSPCSMRLSDMTAEEVCIHTIVIYYTLLLYSYTVLLYIVAIHYCYTLLLYAVLLLSLHVDCSCSSSYYHCM
jgi:hypothetical protein